MTDMICYLEELDGSTTCRIRMSGSLNVSNSLTLHQTVVTICEKYPHVDLLFHDVAAFDVAGIQNQLPAVNDSTAKVTLRIGEYADRVTRWRRVAGIGEGLLKILA